MKKQFTHTSSTQCLALGAHFSTPTKSGTPSVFPCRYFPKKAMVECPECETKIPATAHRCSACGIPVTPKVDTIKDSNDEIIVPMNKTV